MMYYLTPAARWKHPNDPMLFPLNIHEKTNILGSGLNIITKNERYYAGYPKTDFHFWER